MGEGSTHGWLRTTYAHLITIEEAALGLAMYNICTPHHNRGSSIRGPTHGWLRTTHAHLITIEEAALGVPHTAGYVQHMHTSSQSRKQH